MISNKDSTATTEPANPNGGLTQSPELDSSGKPTQRAIKDVGQATNIVSSLVQANRDRQIVNNRILAKYNAERPYNTKALKDEGLSWRSNFTTKPLPQMIEKVAPRFVEAINSVKYLTNACLPVEYANSTDKTEKFREEITTTIRNRREWKTLIEDIALDNALFGYTAVAWLDELQWMPQHFSQDESFFPDGNKQSADKTQMCMLLEVYLPHELYEYIKDPESAKAAGWDVEATAAAINNASPESTRQLLGGTANLETWYQNAQRELTVGSSYQAGANVILVYTLLVGEVTGKVSHYRLVGDREGQKENTKLLYAKDDRYENMNDALALYTFQKGNKRLHGSKGIGRDIYELAGMQDRIRNEAVDRGILSGKTFVQGDMKKIHTFKMSMVGATVIVPDNFKFIEQKIDGNMDNFLKLDAYFGTLVDQLIGSVSPRTFQGDRVTKAEVDLFAQREEEGKDAKISRFMGQLVDMVSTMQRRLCDKNTSEEDAKAMQERLLKKMTREELDILAKQPVANTVRDWTPMQRQTIALVCAEKKGNPLYNQKALEKEDLAARTDSEFSAKVLLPDEDPTEQAEQTRLQLMELSLLQTGQPVPVSVRDNHVIHLKVLQPAAEQIAAAIGQGGSNTAVFEVVINHMQEHYQFALQSGADQAGLAGIAELLKNAGPAIAQMKQLDQQAQQMQESGGVAPAPAAAAPPV